MSDRTFEYLLNAMENAAQSENPAKNGYAAKRRAVFEYVESLQRDRAAYDELRAAIAKLPIRTSAP